MCHMPPIAPFATQAKLHTFQTLQIFHSQQKHFDPPKRVKCVGLARTIYIRCMYGDFSRDITKYTVIYGAYIRFWPTLQMCHASNRPICNTSYTRSKPCKSFTPSKNTLILLNVSNVPYASNCPICHTS